MPGAPLRPMLATPGRLPTGADWAYEFKWDGVRAIAQVKGGATRLWARSGVEITVAYPELAALGQGLPDVLLDGEVVVFDQAGRPSFTALAERMHVRAPARAARLAASLPVTYMIFDLLRLDGTDLTGRPYAQRRAALEALEIAGARWLVPPSYADGGDTTAAAEENALEGVVAKRSDSTYRPGIRSPDWVKVKRELTDDFVIGGWRPGARRVGGLLVGVPTGDGKLLFRGRVGGGIGNAAERDILAALEPLRTPQSPFASALPREDSHGAIWTRPEIVVEVKYSQRTPDAKLRFPRFLRLRPDKKPDEVTDVEEVGGGAG